MRLLEAPVLFSNKEQDLEDPKCTQTSWPPSLRFIAPDSPQSPHHRASCQHSTSKVFTASGFRCSQPYLHFNKRLIKMFSSLKCTGMEFKWRNDRLCVGLIGWVRDITPGCRGELSDDRSCPTRSGLLSPEELKRWTADLPLGARRGPGWKEA